MCIGFLLSVALVISSCSEKLDEAEERQMFDFLLKGTLALEQMQFVHALAYVDSAAEISSSNANVEFFRARVLSALGRYEEAEESYRRVKQIDEHYRGVWSNLGNNSYLIRNYRNAVTFYWQELAENDTSFLAWRGLGRAYGELSIADSALVAFNKAIEYNPRFAGTYYSKSKFMEAEGNLLGALDMALEAWQLKPDNPEYQFHYGALLVKNQREEEAIPILEVVAEKWPWHNGALYNLGQAYVRLGQEQKAKVYLKKAEEARAKQAKVSLEELTVVNFKDDPMSYAKLGSALRMAGRYDDAIRAYKVALNLAPERYEFENNIANLYLIQGDTLQAIQHYRSIVEKNPTLVDVWMNLGVVEALRGNTRAARQAWEHALRHDPSNRQARAYIAGLELEGGHP
jgi:tetratricopeptide (TPR) repeat protein